MHDLRELLRHLQATPNDSAVQRATGLNRRTIARYRAWAQEHALLTGPLPPLEDLQQLVASSLTVPPPPQTVSSVEPFRDLVLQLHAQGVEATAIRLRLAEQHGFTGSVSSLYRFLNRVAPPAPDVPMRIERDAGTEAQERPQRACRSTNPLARPKPALRYPPSSIRALSRSKLPLTLGLGDQIGML